VFLDVADASPTILEDAAAREPWPHPSSVGVVDGQGVIVLSKDGGEER
jgi:hypothetical protein